MNIFKTMGGKIECVQCSAKSKRTKLQCRSPALKGKRTCRIHGGLSTGPKTDSGRLRCGAAKTVHGQDTRALRASRGEDRARLVALEQFALSLGIINGKLDRK